MMYHRGRDTMYFLGVFCYGYKDGSFVMRCHSGKGALGRGAVKDRVQTYLVGGANYVWQADSEVISAVNRRI